MQKFVASVAFALFALSLHAGSAFTYQGMLNDGGKPATGHYNMLFELYSDSNAVNLVAAPQTNLDVSVSNGFFTVLLDFGPVFTNSNYWVQIGVRTNQAAIYVSLTPLLPITPAPLALYAPSATNTLTGVVAIPQNQLSVQITNLNLSVPPPYPTLTVIAPVGYPGSIFAFVVGPTTTNGFTIAVSTPPSVAGYQVQWQIQR